MVEVTLPVWVGMLTGSPGHVAGVAAAEILPSLLAGPFAGALADRLDARKAMIVCDLVRAVLVLSLLLAPVSLLVPCVYAVGFLVALVGLLFNPAKNVTPSSRSSGRDRQAARSPPRAPQSQRPWCWGPTLGSAVLLAFGPAAGLVFDALTLVARAGAVASATVPRPLSGDGSAVSPVRGLVAEVGEGFRVVRRDADLLATLAAGSVVYLAGVVWFSVDVSFVETALGASEESVGALWAASGAGSRGARGPRGPEAGVLEGPDSGRVGREWCRAVVVRALDELRLGAGGVVRLRAQRFAGRGGCGERDDAALPPAALGRVSALFEAAGRHSALVALLVLGLVQDLVSPAHAL